MTDLHDLDYALRQVAEQLFIEVQEEQGWDGHVTLTHQRLREAVIRGMEVAAKVVEELASEYRKCPLDIYDKPESWRLIDEVLESPAAIRSQAQRLREIGEE